MGSGGADATTINTTTAEGGESSSTSEVRDYIEQACIALQVVKKAYIKYCFKIIITSSNVGSMPFSNLLGFDKPGW